MKDGVGLVVEVDESHARRRVKTGFCQKLAHCLDTALALVEELVRKRLPLSVALVGNAATVAGELVRRGVIPDVVTDQTSAHDALEGYVPEDLSVEEAAAMRKADPAGYLDRSRTSMSRHCEATVTRQDQGAVVFDYGNNLRGQAQRADFERAFAYPGFVPAYIRPR